MGGYRPIRPDFVQELDEGADTVGDCERFESNGGAGVGVKVPGAAGDPNGITIPGATSP